jgi:NAD(P)-dependent dehydrogenase (short-subunit alcohol dehydrogenase family)
MSDRKDRREIRLTLSQLARRRFLERAVLVTAGGAVASTLSATGRAATPAQASPKNCSDVKAPMQDVEGKVAFITGGSSGIGLGIARAFANARMKVVIGYRTKEHLEEAMKFLKSAEGRVHAINVDVTNRPGMEKAAAETTHVFGKVHVLVNNAGVNGFAPLSRTTYDDWDWIMNVNVNGVFNGVHAFLPRIQAQGEGGQIITTSSIGGLITGSAAASYTASKFAVVGMMEALRAEFADTNIGVSVYCPGVVASNLVESRRNRPSSLADTAFNQKMMVSVAEQMKNPDLAMDPLEAGELVLRGMRSNDLYILTHPEYEPVMRARYEALMVSIPTDLRPTDTQVELMRPWNQSSIYSTELNRRLCAQAARAKVTK